MITFSVNSRTVRFDGDPTTPLLWVLRDHLQLTGTKFGCGIGQCGACTVHINGNATRSCLIPIDQVANQQVDTIEGLAPTESHPAESTATHSTLHPVQRAWLEQDVAQCGYCQAGQIMATVDFLRRYPKPTDADINANITNLCRCGTYVRMRKAIHRAAELIAQES